MRSSEANADARTEYTEDNPHPSFRPSVSALSYKLRSMKQIQNDEALLWVLDQQIFWRWVSKPNPDYVFRLLAKLYFYWGSALGRRETFGQSIDALKLEYLHFEPQQEVLPENRSLPQAGEREQLQPSPEAWSSELREEVSSQIINHERVQGYQRNGVIAFKCTCGKEFDFLEEWAKHVRIRIKRTIDATSTEGR